MREFVMAIILSALVAGGIMLLPYPSYQTVDLAPAALPQQTAQSERKAESRASANALSRAERGLVGILQVEGAPNPEIFDGKIESGGGH